MTTGIKCLVMRQSTTEKTAIVMTAHPRSMQVTARSDDRSGAPRRRRSSPASTSAAGRRTKPVCAMNWRQSAGADG